MYEGIPHLFTPIITEAKLAANALRNAVREMERRLKLLAANHVRNIDQFNKLFDNGSEYLFDDVDQEPLPYIIIIIDELADLMMLDPRQRRGVDYAPRPDGPRRRHPSRARHPAPIRRCHHRPHQGQHSHAHQLPPGHQGRFAHHHRLQRRRKSARQRRHALPRPRNQPRPPPARAFVTEKEISAVTAFWKAQGEAEYVHGFLEGPKDEAGNDGLPSQGDEDNDDLFDDAVRLVFEFGKASTSLLQRRLRIGYGRAAQPHRHDGARRPGRPADGSKPREILKAPNYYKEVDAALR